MEKMICTELKQLFAQDHSGHDYWHTLRVHRNAQKIADGEACDRQIVMLAALLHDADDVKLFHTQNYENARRIMNRAGVSQDIQEKAIAAIRTVSFKGTDSVTPDTIEGKIVQDADRLDALGAIGIARTFAYGGSRGRAMHDPDESPNLHMNAETYAKSQGTSINHFYEKLLLLKDQMNTKTAKTMAEHRHQYMQDFLNEFFEEWG